MTAARAVFLATTMVVLVAGAGLGCGKVIPPQPDASPARPDPSQASSAFPGHDGGRAPNPGASTPTAPVAAAVIPASLAYLDSELEKMTMQHWMEDELATLPPTRWTTSTVVFEWSPPQDQLLPLPMPEAEALGERILAKLREPADAAVQVALERAPRARQNAWQLLAALGEIAIPALADARFADASDRVRAATIAVTSELALRATIASSIEPMFDDRAPPETWTVRPTLERRCNLAFGLMRELQCPGNDLEGRREDVLALDRRSASERDQLIAEARAGAFHTDPKGRTFYPLRSLVMPERRTPPKAGAAVRTARMERELDGMRAEDVSAFAGGLVERLRQPARVAARISQDWAEKLRWPAQLVTAQLREQSVVPLIEPGSARAPFDRNPLYRHHRFDWAIWAALAVRHRVFVMIDNLLGDKTPLPHTPPASAPAAPRVCDAGYALMRKALHFGSELADPFASEAAFYALAEPERDAMISRARMTPVWGQLH